MQHMEATSVTIGSIKIDIFSPDSDFIKDINDKYRFFLKSKTSTASYTLVADHTTGAFDIDSTIEQPIQVNDNDGTYHVLSEDFRAEVIPADNEIKSWLRPNADVFDSLLRVVLSLVYIDHGGFFLHAAGLQYKGSGSIFSGPSSSGKTTLASSVGQEFLVASDELVLVHKTENGFVMQSTPFSGEYTGEVTDFFCPLQYVFFLTKTLASDYHRVTTGDTIPFILENVFFFSQHRDSSQKLLKLTAELVTNIECFQVNLFRNNRLKELFDVIE